MVTWVEIATAVNKVEATVALLGPAAADDSRRAVAKYQEFQEFRGRQSPQSGKIGFNGTPAAEAIRLTGLKNGRLHLSDNAQNKNFRKGRHDPNRL